MTKCKQCGREYEAKRSTSAYCSPKCKQEFYRNRTKPDVTLRDAKLVTVTGAKRGKDIKCFEDLPPDVQATIKRMSSNNGGVTWDITEKAKRTAAAIKYQHLFPDRHFPHDDELTLRPVGRVGDSASEWIKANRKGAASEST